MLALLIILLAAAFLGALALALAGVTLLAWPTASSSTHAITIILPLMASLSGTGESIIVKRARLGRDVLSVTAWQFIFGAVPLFASEMLESGQQIAWTGSFLRLLGFLAIGG